MKKMILTKPIEPKSTVRRHKAINQQQNKSDYAMFYAVKTPGELKYEHP